MKTFKKPAFVIVAALLGLTLFSCGGGGGGGTPPATTVISGQVVDAFVAGATVTAYQMNADGTQGAQIGTPVQTDQSGNYVLDLGTYFGPVLITSTGGTFTDTATGNTIDLTTSTLTLSAIVPNASGSTTAHINPLTTMATNVAVTLAGQGTPLATAADAANASIQDYFGLSSPILETALVDLTATGCMTGADQVSADVSAILAGISQLAYDNGVSPIDLVESLIQDVASDGLFDGAAGGAAISVPLTSGAGTIPLSTIEGTALTGLATAITSFMNTSTSNICEASVDPGVISALSAENIFTTPAAPTGVTATAGPGSVLLTWETVTSATSYNVYLATSTGVTATSTQLPGYRSILNVTGPRATVAGLTAGTTYYFVVTAVSGAIPYTGSESVESSEVSANVTASALPASPQWARTVTAGSDQTIFSSVAVAPDGSVYAAGYGIGTGTYDFGNNVTAAGTDASYNILLVKYNSSGTAQWARTVTAGSDYSQFYSVSVAPDGSVYAAGYIAGVGDFDFGNGVTAAGASISNVVLVKYNSSGAAQWARTVAAGNDHSLFSSVAVASDGSVYAAGYIVGTGTYDFGNSVTAAGAYGNSANVVLVKYDSSGAAQWARTATTGSGVSSFDGVTAASDGSVYAAGSIAGTGTYDFGNSVTAAGTYSGYNIVLVKYDGSGAAQWARTVTAGNNQSSFSSVAASSDGSVYAAGYGVGTGTYDFGNSATATGASTGDNLVLVKYDSSGTAQWAQTVTAGSDYSQFNSVSVSPDGSVYATGYIAGTGTYDFGNSVTAAGTNGSFNLLLVNYDSSGATKWAQTVMAGSSDSDFYSVAVASDGSVYTAGFIAGTGTYDFGDGVTAAGTYGGYNILLAKYTVSLTPVITATAGPNGSISPAGAVPVTYNGSQTFTITADAGYIIAAVLVDGVPVSGQSNATFSYTFTNVTADHTIDATFTIITGSGGTGGTGF